MFIVGSYCIKCWGIENSYNKFFDYEDLYFYGWLKCLDDIYRVLFSCFIIYEICVVVRFRRLRKSIFF